MSKKPLVLFLPKWYPHRFDAFDGNFVENHAIAISKFCSPIILFVHSDPHLQQKFEIEEKIEHSFPVIRIYFRKAQSSLPLLALLINSLRYLSAQFKAYRHLVKKHAVPELCHIHVLGRTAPLALYLQFMKRIPFLVTEHSSTYQPQSQDYIGSFKRLLYSFIVRKARLVTVVSTNLKEAMLKHGLKNKYTLIPNVVDTSIFRPIQREESVKKRIIHVSNLSKRPKNMHRIIEALEDIGKERDDFELILIGTGPDEEEMRKKVEASNLSTLTSFKGECSKEKVAEEMAKSDVLILFSLYENQPCVIIEAFASGIPVISSDVGGISEMVGDMGQLVAKDDIEAFKKAILRHLNSERQYSFEKIRSYALQHFSQERVGRSFFDCYQSILGKE